MKRVEPGTHNASEADAARVQELEYELANTKHHLQTYIEEIETSNEELPSLNEELQSTNQEFQSTNEEIQIAYAELKHSHEELAAKEEQLQIKEADTQALLNNDLQAFFMVDAQYQLLSFNHKAEETIHLLRGKSLARGQSVVDLLPTETLPDFLDSFGQVLAGEPFATEWQLFDLAGAPHWFSLNLHPVQLENGTVRGMSIGLLKVTDLKAVLSELNATEQRVKSVFDATKVGICITDERGRFVDVNQERAAQYPQVAKFW